MSPAFDIDALLPSDDERHDRRRALVAELSASPQAAVGSSRRRSTRRAFVRGGLAAAGVAAAGLASTDLLPGIGGSPVDVVASARAAAARTDGILHTLVRYEHGPYISMAKLGRTRLDSGRAGADAVQDLEVMGQLTGDTETWSTESPVRERRVMFVDLEDSDRIGRSETSQGPREWRTHDSWDDFVLVRRISAEENAKWLRARRRDARNLAHGFGANGNPVAAIRRLLDSGRLRDAGSSNLDGRAVARLVGRAPSYIDAGGTRIQPVDYEYLVDAETFVPVRITSTQVLPARPHAEEPAARHVRRIVQRWTFERFERLPLTAQTEGLLTVDTTGLRVVRPRPVKPRPTP